MPPLAEDAREELNHSTKAKPLDTCKAVQMTIYQFFYTFNSTLLMLSILPMESQRMHQTNVALYLGLWYVVFAVAQLPSPLLGKLSDQHSSKFGKRRPYVLLGSAVHFAGTGGMWMSSVFMWPVFFTFCFGASILGTVIGYAGFIAMPKDYQEEEDRKSGVVKADGQEADTGFFSGLIALQNCLAAMLCMVAVALTRHSFQNQYPVLLVTTVVFTGLQCLSLDEVPTHLDPAHEPLTFAQAKKGYVLDMETDADFVWVVINRYLYYMCMSMSSVSLYFCEDVMGYKDPAVRNLAMAESIVMSQLCAMVVAVPMSSLSNVWGRKCVVYIASALIMSGTLLLVATPKISSPPSFNVMQIANGIIGMGLATYCSVDYALAMETLPKTRTTSEALGLLGVAAFFGSAVGPLTFGIILMLHKDLAAMSIPRIAGGDGELFPVVDHYTYLGYFLGYMFNGFFCGFLVAWSTTKIKGIK